MSLIIDMTILIIILLIWYIFMQIWVRRLANKIAEIIERNTKEVIKLRKQIKEQKDE